MPLGEESTEVPWAASLPPLPHSIAFSHGAGWRLQSFQQHRNPAPCPQGVPLQFGIIPLFRPWMGAAAAPPELGDARQSQVWGGKSAPDSAPLDFYHLIIFIQLQRFPLYMQARGVCGGSWDPQVGALLGEKPFSVGTPALASADALLKGAEQTHGNWQRARRGRRGRN